MKDEEVPGGNSDGGYNKLISQEDGTVDEQALYSVQDKQQVSVSMSRPESSLTRYKRLTVFLAVLAAVLLAVDIGLGVYYNKLAGRHQTVTDVAAEVNKLEASYSLAIQRRDESRKELARVINEQQVFKWELEHQKKRNKEYEKQSDTLMMEITAMASHVPLIEEGCRHCLAGWTYINSMCYYFTFSEDILRRSWQEARQFCSRQGGDLAQVDTREKNMAITELINAYQNPSRPIVHSGYWIGLRDVDEEGTWKWTDGTRLIEGYWNDGEPNNEIDEDCAAAYPRSNPFKSWNDAPCHHSKKWICQMLPKASL